ncbi:MAG TPA: YkgJ family cysteine cluster protein [Terriglobales bacterium]|nr:YkgJ family cysteine cluster protein [Terriglobales bacterium]
MRRDKLLLRTGYVLSAVASVGTYLGGFGLLVVATVLVIGVILTRVGIYSYYERYLAFRAFHDFSEGKVKHECIACGASCHLKVNLDRNDAERILKYAEQEGIKETIIEKRGRNYWLKRKSSGACVFLRQINNLPRCSIYSIRPTACRLYPLIPSGQRLKVDPLCPGLSNAKGHTFKEHLTTQEVGPYVRKALGKI